MPQHKPEEDRKYSVIQVSDPYLYRIIEEAAIKNGRSLKAQATFMLIDWLRAHDYVREGKYIPAERMNL